MAQSALLADIRRTYAYLSGSRLRRSIICLRSSGIHAVVIFRFGQWVLRRNKILRLITLMDVWYQFLDLGLQLAWGIELPRRATIGGGLYIGHFGAITISGEAVIGRNCTVSQGVTIGVSGEGPKSGVPVIGDDVYLAPGARLFGKIHVGNNVKIGANAVIHKDIPDNAIVVLDPGFKIISFRGNRRPAQPVEPAEGTEPAEPEAAPTTGAGEP
jgi:serine O-acetyltransferase